MNGNTVDLMSELSPREKALVEQLPKPPRHSTFTVSGLLILEWLSSAERQTGQELYEWMENYRPGWATLVKCASKADVLREIDAASARADAIGYIPVLHIEAHGDNNHMGLVGPDGAGRAELLSWEELVEPLQGLNLATRCNLLLFCAACTGIAAMQVMVRGPRAPVLAVAGPVDEIYPRDLLLGAKEFYRRLRDEGAHLQSAVDGSSIEVGVVDFIYEPFVGTSYDAFVEQLICGLRPENRLERRGRLLQRLMSEKNLDESEARNYMRRLPEFQDGHGLQTAWDEMFMIDVFPGNRERFGLDVVSLVRTVNSEVSSWERKA